MKWSKEQLTQLPEQQEGGVAIRVEAGDYLQDSLIFCGRCHTARQVRVYLPWKQREQVMACMCRCEKEAEERKQADFVREQRFRRVQELLPQGVAPSFRRTCTFAADDGADPRTMQVLQRYVQHFDQAQQTNTGLLLCGQPGCGKTYAAACVANALLEQRYTVLMTSVSALLQELNDYRGSTGGYLRRLCCYDLLILDDLIKPRQNSGQELLCQVLEERSRTGRPLLITTSLTPDKLEGQRILDQLQALCVPLQMNGAGRRRHIGVQKLQWAKETLLR